MSVTWLATAIKPKVLFALCIRCKTILWSYIGTNFAFLRILMTFFLVWGNGQRKGLEAQHSPSPCYVSLTLNVVNLRPTRNSRSLDEQLISLRPLMWNSFYLRPWYFNDGGRRWKLLLYGRYKKCPITKCTRTLRGFQCLKSAPLGQIWGFDRLICQFTHPHPAASTGFTT